MEEVKECKVCGSPEKELLSQYGAPEKMRMPTYICRSCGVVYQTPRMTYPELKGYYANYSNEINTKELIDERFEKWLLQIASLRFRFLKKYIKDNYNIIDVGCGPGCLLSLIKKENPATHLFGINPEESYSDFGRRHYGLDINSKTFEDARITPGSYNLVIFDHVFGHMNEPRDTMVKIREILKDGGYLFISTRNIITPHGFLWQNFSLDHPFTYSPNTLARLLNEFDFEIVELDTDGHVTYEGYHYPYMTLIAQKKRVESKSRGDNYIEVKEKLKSYERDYAFKNLYHSLTYNTKILLKGIGGRYLAGAAYYAMTKPLPKKIRPRLYNYTYPPERIE